MSSLAFRFRFRFGSKGRDRNGQKSTARQSVNQSINRPLSLRDVLVLILVSMRHFKPAVMLQKSWPGLTMSPVLILMSLSPAEAFSTWIRAGSYRCQNWLMRCIRGMRLE